MEDSQRSDGVGKPGMRLQYFIAISYLVIVVGLASFWREPGVAGGQAGALGRAQVTANGQERAGVKTIDEKTVMYHEGERSAGSYRLRGATIHRLID